MVPFCKSCKKIEKQCNGNNPICAIQAEQDAIIFAEIEKFLRKRRGMDIDLQNITERLVSFSQTFKNIIHVDLNIVQGYLSNSERDSNRLFATVSKRNLDTITYRSYRVSRDRNEYNVYHNAVITEGETLNLGLYPMKVVNEQLDEIFTSVSTHKVYKLNVVISRNTYENAWDGCAYLTEVA